MNDPDSSSSINSNWLNVTNELSSICEDKGITLILTTTPNVSGGYSDDNPTRPARLRYHEFKNEWVRNSGYRYVDFSLAVGADSNGFWHEGMLYTDGVHPTSLGAQALAMQVLVDFPEIMQNH